MNARHFTGLAAAVFGVFHATMGGFAQTQPSTRGPAEGGSPAWSLQGSFPDPGGNTIVDADGRVTIPPRTGGGTRGATIPAASTAAPIPPTPSCARSPLCGNRLTPGRQSLQRVTWEQALGYTYTYPYVLPAGNGGVPAVALDSRGNLWVFQRKAAGNPQLYKFDPDHKLILQVGDDVIGHQDKAHGMAVDAEDNVWISDANGSTVMKLSPKGELLLTIGVRGRRGDWDEAKGQRLLWQPVMIAFGPNGDIYIGEGHANESPNDTDSGDPTNNLGVARVIRRPANSSASGMATVWARGSSIPSTASRSTQQTAMSGSAIASNIALLFTAVMGSFSRRCKCEILCARFSSIPMETHGWLAVRMASS